MFNLNKIDATAQKVFNSATNVNQNLANNPFIFFGSLSALLFVVAFLNVIIGKKNKWQDVFDITPSYNDLISWYKSYHFSGIIILIQFRRKSFYTKNDVDKETIDECYSRTRSESIWNCKNIKDD